MSDSLGIDNFEYKPKPVPCVCGAKETKLKCYTVCCDNPMKAIAEMADVLESLQYYHGAHPAFWGQNKIHPGRRIHEVLTNHHNIIEKARTNQKDES